MHRKILEANMPVTIVNGRLLRIFFNFLICKPYNKPFVHMKAN